MADLETEGRFKVHPIGKGIDTAKTGAIGAAITFFITHWYEPAKQDWMPCHQKNLMLEHTFWMYKADNSPIEFSIKQVKAALGWSGDILDFDEQSEWKMPDCEIETAFEEYNNKRRLRVKWLNPIGGRKRGATSRAELQKIKERLTGQAPVQQFAQEESSPQLTANAGPPDDDSDSIPF